MPEFIPYDYNQSSMVVINFEEQLQPGTFEHAIHHLIDSRLDMSVFYPRVTNDDTGRPAYDPSILLKIILFAYSKGLPQAERSNGNVSTILSSRRYPVIARPISPRLPILSATGLTK
jgi:transposase